MVSLSSRIPRSSMPIVLAIGAFAVRAVAVLVLSSYGNATDNAAPTTYEHGAIADNLLAGRGFSIWFLGSEGPTSQQAPFVPLLLAFCSWPFGQVVWQSVLAFQLLQCIAGACMVMASARLAWTLFPERRGIGWFVGCAAALHPPLVYMATHVQAAPWAALGVVSLFALLAEARGTPSRKQAVQLGLIGGMLLLIDPIYALLAPIIIASLALGAKAQVAAGCDVRSTLRSPAWTAVCCLVVVAPWLLRNVAVHGEFVFVKSTFGYALWQGNNAASFGTDKIPKPSVAAMLDDHDGSLAGRNRALWEARHETLYIDDVLLKPAGYAEFAGLSEPQRSQLLGRRAVQWIVDHPVDYLRLCGKRLRYFLLWDETNPKTANALYRASSGIWLAISAMGLLAARKQWRVLMPTVVAFLTIMLFHTLTIMSARFRIPLEPLGLLWAGVGFQPAVSNVARRVRNAWIEARAEVAAAVGGAEGRAVPNKPHLGKVRKRSRAASRRR